MENTADRSEYFRRYYLLNQERKRAYYHQRWLDKNISEMELPKTVKVNRIKKEQKIQEQLNNSVCKEDYKVRYVDQEGIYFGSASNVEKLKQLKRTIMIPENNKENDYYVSMAYFNLAAETINTFLSPGNDEEKRYNRALLKNKKITKLIQMVCDASESQMEFGKVMKKIKMANRT